MSTATALQPITVLLVEDNPGDARLILELLGEVQSQAFDLERVDRLDDALARLTHTGVDVVLLDLGLPDSQGLDTFVRARQRHPAEPIVVISGLDDEQVALQAVRLGAQDYLVKGRIEGHLLARVLRHAIERKHAEEELRLAQEQYRMLFESTPLSSWVFDLNTHAILAVNDAAVLHYGYPRAEFLTLRIEDLRPAEDVPALEGYLDTLRAGVHSAGAWRHRKKDGTVITVEINGHPLSWEGRDAELVVLHDVTERRRSEAALRQSEQTYRSLVDNAPYGIYRSSVDGRFLSVNPALVTMLGYGSATEVLELDLGRDVYADAAERARLVARDEPGETYALETTWKRRDGRPITVRLTGRAEGSADREIAYSETVVEDITERRKAEEALAERERRFRALIENSTDAIAMFAPDGRITYASPATASVLGYDSAEFEARNAFDLIHPEDLARIRPDLIKGLRGSERKVALEARVRHRDGSWRLCEGMFTNLLRDPAVGAVVANYRDVTERRGLEQQLRQAQKMEAVGRLAGGVAHDFNNVLTAIFGYADLVLEEMPADSPARQDLEEIRKAAQRASALTRQLLAFSRQQVLEPVVLSMNDLAQDIDNMVHRLVGEDVELRLSLSADVGNVRADPGQLTQVIMNLAVNARDAMPAGGKLLIETANADLAEQYAELHQPVIPGHYVMLAVSDTGTGMDAETRARIFEPFFTTKERGKGTGLGLSTVYGIVKQSGGYIWVYSEPGRGTTFKVYLPRVDAPAQPVAAPREAGTVAGVETILLAEDDEMLRPLAKGLLEKLGYTVLEAENATQALARAGAHTGPIQLLVADVVMPGASGRELARRLADARPDTRVLYVSGYTDDAIVHHGMLEPGLNFLQKPFTPAALARKVRDVLDAS